MPCAYPGLSKDLLDHNGNCFCFLPCLSLKLRSFNISSIFRWRVSVPYYICLTIHEGNQIVRNSNRGSEDFQCEACLDTSLPRRGWRLLSLPVSAIRVSEGVSQCGIHRELRPTVEELIAIATQGRGTQMLGYTRAEHMDVMVHRAHKCHVEHKWGTHECHGAQGQNTRMPCCSAQCTQNICRIQVLGPAWIRQIVG
jgi:hypothetical protein